MTKANRKKYKESPGANIHIGCLTEFEKDLARPRPPEMVFTRHDGVRIHFCASPTVYENEEFNRRYVQPGYKRKAAE